MAVPLRKVLVPDPVHQNCVRILEEYGIQVTHGVKLTPQQLLQTIPDYDGLIVRSETKVTSEVLTAGAKGRLRAVGRAGTGVDNIDVDAATKLGIYVLNTPGGNSLSACELTCALISAVARNVGAGVSSMKVNRWDRKQLMGTELYGKTLGVVGLGRIGREVSLRMRSFGMRIIGFDPLVTSDQAAKMGVLYVESLEEMWPVADYITFHVPLNQHTKDLMNQATFAKCKRGIKVINVARGGIINEQDLLSALNDGQCGGAGLDVFTEEPPKSQHLWDLIKHPLVTPTPHLGASTDEAQVRVAEEIAQQFVALAKPGSPFCVSGAINSDVLAACSDIANTSLVMLARTLGSLVASNVTLDQSSLSVHTQSDEAKRWVTGVVLEGICGDTGPGMADKASFRGIRQVQYSHTPDPELKQITLTLNTAVTRLRVKGNWRGDTPTIISVNDNGFEPEFPLTPTSVLIKTQDINPTLQQLLGDGKNIKSMAISRSPQETWICLN